MSVRLYNSLTRATDELAPLVPGTISMYVCGPTVYDQPHIGHARSAYMFDVLRRYLAFRGYQVRFVRNVTDVDDKIIDKARQIAGDRGQATGDVRAGCQEVAERYLASYHKALERLGVQRPTEEPRATAHIPQMQHMIQTLIARGVAYAAGGDVYFAVRQWPGYGKLSTRSLDELVSGARVEPGEHKRDPLDFALWKSAKPGEPSWDSPWGKGRPGWHIECSAMSTQYLGDTFDVHGGGVDLLFPHHENEIAQAEAAGKAFARCWVHNGLLTVSGEKMSKSLGNYTTVEQALTLCRGQADVLKMFFLSAHYRSPLDYNERDITQASRRWDRLYHLVEMVKSLRGSPSTALEPASPTRQRFEAAMDDDLNTPSALAVIDGLLTRGHQLFEQAVLNKRSDSATKEEIEEAGRQLDQLVDELIALAQVLGLFLSYHPTELPEEFRRRIDERKEARARKDFRTADEIRAWFANQGYQLVDHDDGTTSVARVS